MADLWYEIRRNVLVDFITLQKWKRVSATLNSNAMLFISFSIISGEVL